MHLYIWVIVLCVQQSLVAAQFPPYGNNPFLARQYGGGPSDNFYWQQQQQQFQQQHQQQFQPNNAWQWYNGYADGGPARSRTYRHQGNYFGGGGGHGGGHRGGAHGGGFGGGGYGGGGFGGGGFGSGGGGYHHYRPYDQREYWLHAHRASPSRYRNFKQVFRDVEREGVDNKQFNATAEDAETDDDFNGRSMAAPGQYPHMAAIGFRSNAERVTFKCGGSLISELYVLTAAHCCEINGEAPYMVKLGDINLRKIEWDLRPQRRFVANYFQFPDYNATLHYHDIALIQLVRPVEYTEFVRPIRLWANDEIPYERVYTMGYGSTSFAQAPTNILTELALSIVSLEKCNKIMPRDESAPFGVIDSQICAKDYIKNRDTCQGDSGGPLQLNLERRRKRRYGNQFRYYLVGIISYGGFCRGQLPGVYTRVSSYIDWIASIVWPQYFDFNSG